MREPRTLPARVPTLSAPVSSTLLDTSYRQLYKLHKKLTTHKSHLSFLTTCLRNGLTPKGLIMKNVPTVTKERSGQLVWKEWSRILHQTSLLLMKTLKKYHSDMITTLTDDIQCIENNLHMRLDFPEQRKTVLDSIKIHEGKLMERKQTKLMSLFKEHPSLNKRRKRRKRKRTSKTNFPPQSIATPGTPTNTVVNLSNVSLSESEYLS